MGVSTILTLGFIWGLHKLYQCFVFEEETHSLQENNSVLGLLAGFIFISIGIFPYIVVGRSIIYIDGVNGRDSLFVPLGAAVFLYYGISLCPIRKHLSHIVCSVIVILSMGCMNKKYVGYQEATYQQMAIGNHMRESKEIREGQNFLWVNSKNYDWFRFYVLTGIAQEVFQDEKRLFLSERNLHSYSWFQQGIVKNMMPWHYFHLGEYDLTHLEIDGVILYQYTPISTGAVLKLKFDELFRKALFEQKIHELGHIDYIHAKGYIMNDRDMKTMWSKKMAVDVLKGINQ